MKHISRYLMIPGMVMLVASVFTACKDDEPVKGEPYFTIENLDNLVIPQKGIDMSTFTQGKKLIIRANGTWQLVPENHEAVSWTKIHPMDGEDDGIIRVYCDENLNANVREARFKVYINGQETSQVLSYSQEGCAPFLNLSASQLTLKRTGGTVSVSVDANFEWDCRISGENASRFTAVPVSAKEIEISTSIANTSGEDLSAELEVYGKGEFSELGKTINIVQLYATFFDDFSWLPNPKAGILGWNANGAEAGMDSWTDEQIAHGWTSVSRWFYYRDKFVKFGKGGFGGDACSPSIPEIGSASDVTVSWSLLGYATGKNVKDNHNMFYVAVLGPGKITGCSSTGELGHSITYRDGSRNVELEAVRFILDENAWMLKSVDPTATVIWQTPSAQFNIDVKGMDGTSRVVFVAGPGSIDNLYADPNGWNSRMFMDNFKVIVN